ncbi:MAG: hypothetical protein R2867_31030 [Caldilineaceae bacterium]
MPHTNDLLLVPNQGWMNAFLSVATTKWSTPSSVVTQRYVILVDTVINPATARPNA